ncbi:hypothetical protein GQ53DRAFT_746989 [Thozetella sp. PMI_491]|nr:hypothetical protein GQ53DRAFT_746989 [Thozetella sp. PMI_491]
MPSPVPSGPQPFGFGLFLHTLLLVTAFIAPFVTADATAVVVSASGNYKYNGCFNETTGLNGTSGVRALDGGKHDIQPGNMTVEMCTSFCNNDATPYKYAGLEFSRCVARRASFQCYCREHPSPSKTFSC